MKVIKDESGFTLPLYQMSRIDLIKFLRASVPGGMGLLEAKNATDSYLFHETLSPAIQDTIYRLRDLVTAEVGLRMDDIKKLL